MKVSVRGCLTLSEDILIILSLLLIWVFVYYILSYSFGSIFFYHFTSAYGCVFCMLLFNFVNYTFLLLCYVFLLLCMFYFVYYVSLCCSVYCFMCKCVMYYCHQVSTQMQLTNTSNSLFKYLATS